jgi:hypothetical protein
VRGPREFWWASYKGEAPQVVEIGRVDGQMDWCCFTGTDWNLSAPLDDLRLVAPVIPPSIEGDVAAVTAEHHRDLGVAMATAMMAFFRASFEGGTPLIALRESHMISADVQVDVERWYGAWDAKHREGIAAMHRAMDLLREAKGEVAA